MQTRTKLLPLLLGAVLVPTLLAGCTPQPNSNGIAISNGKGGVTSAQPAGTVKTPTPAPTFTSDPSLLSNDSIVKLAVKDFPGVKATSKHSQEEVLKALFSARFALNDMQNTKNYINGKWATDGYPTTYTAPMASYFTEKGYAKLLNDVAELLDNQQARGDFQLLATYFPASDGNYVLCPDASTCQVEGYPAYSNLKYGDAKGGGVYAEFDIENRYIAEKDGVKGYIPVTKSIKLSLVPNEKYQADLGNMPYVISGWSGSYERGSFAQ